MIFDFFHDSKVWRIFHLLVHLVCFISNYLFEQPVNVVQFLMVVASWLLNFKRKFPMVVAYVFWEILKNWYLMRSTKIIFLLLILRGAKNITILLASNQQILLILWLTLKETLWVSYKWNFSCLANSHELLNWFKVNGLSCLYFSKISTGWKIVAYKRCL